MKSTVYPLRVALLLALLVSCMATLFAQTQEITRSTAWPSVAGAPKLGDTLMLAWSKPAYEYVSKGTAASMQLIIDHTDRFAARAMDLDVVIEAKLTVNKDLTRYDKRADRDSLFRLHFQIGKRSQGAANAVRVAPDSLLKRAFDAKDRELFTCANAHRMEFRLVQVTMDDGKGRRQLTELPQGVRFEADLTWNFTPKMLLAAPLPNNPAPVNCTGNTSTVDEIILSWSPIGGAYTYHLEWTWVDNYNAPGTGTIIPDYDLQRNATRVSLDQFTTKYRLPLLFDRGWIVWRVRAMGAPMAPFGTPTYGSWSLAASTGSVSGLGAHAYHILNAHQPDVNWQVTTSFAEEGKRKEVMTYADGTLRSRQAVTRNNSLYVPILGETFYDAVGRPAVESMPVPMVLRKQCPNVLGSDDWAPIDLYPRFNNADEDSDPIPEDYQYFHMLPQDGDCEAAAVPFHRKDGAELYYHEDHLSVSDPLTGLHKFLPKSFGYPFTQTEFSRDNTGRVRRKSGVGDNFRLGTDHETLFLYGKPEQIKLDRLFGSEAGYATHYQKNLVIDANGQASVSYLDRAGRTIATALAGGSHDGQLENLPSLGAMPTLQTDLFCGQSSLDCEANQELPDVPALVFTDQIVVPANGLTYMFDYKVTPGLVEDPCLLENICMHCVYELTISLVDACGVEHICENGSATVGTFEITPGGALDFSCTTPAQYDHTDITVPNANCAIALAPGEYTLTKILRVSTEVRDAYVAEILANGTLYLDEDCYTPLEEFQTAFTAAIDSSGCEIGCEECEAALGTLENFVLGGGTPADYQQLYDQCWAPCTADSWCDVAYQAMLVDMTLGGQYASITVDGNGATSADDRASVFYYDLNTDEPSILLSRGYDWNVDHYQYNQAGFQNVDRYKELWRQPRLFENGGYIHEYRGESGLRYSIPVEMIDGLWTPAIEGNDPAHVYPDGSGGFITYPEFLETLDLFISYWQPGFENSLLFYHPEFCYWLNCRGYAEVVSNDTWSSDDFDEELMLMAPEVTDMPTFISGLITRGWLDLTHPTGERVRFIHDQTSAGGSSYPTNGDHDPFARNSTYDPFGGQLLAKVAQYKELQPGGQMLSMEEFAAIMGFCTTIPVEPIDPAWLDFLGSSVPPEIKVRQWNAFKSFYFSEKYRAQKRRADATVASCWSGCSSLNYCIGQGEDDAWIDRMQAPVMLLDPPWWPGDPPYFWPPGAQALYLEHQAIYSQQFGRPYVQGCQLCNGENSEYFVDKVPRVPDPEQFPGMDMSPDEIAFENYMATGDCPVAAAWRALIEERAIQDELVGFGTDLTNEPGWAGLVIAQDGQGAPIPTGTWDGAISGSTLNIMVNGCPASLTLDDPNVLITYGFTFTDFLDAVFAAPGIQALSANLFTLHVQFMDANLDPHATTLTGSVCGSYDLINCTFPPVGTGNQLAADLTDLLSVIAAADEDPVDILTGSGVNLNTTPTTQPVPANSPFPGTPAGPMIQTQVPDAFTSGDWDDDLYWNYDQLTATFTLTNGTGPGACPSYVIQILSFEVPDASPWTLADLEDVFSFNNMVSEGANLFSVDAYSEPDWVNEVPPEYLATLHGSVTYIPCSGDPEGPSLGDFGSPDAAMSCSDQTVELTRRLYEVMTHLLIQAPDQHGFDLTTSPYMDWDLLAQLYSWQIGGMDPLTSPGIFADDEGGPLTVWPSWPTTALQSLPYPATEYGLIILDNSRCPWLYYEYGTMGPGQLMDVSDVTGFSEPVLVGTPNGNGNYEAFAFFALGPDGEPLHEYPFIVYAPCLELNFCDNCAMDGPFLPNIPIPDPLSTDCHELAIDLNGAIMAFNASPYSQEFTLDLDPEPDAYDLAQSANVCPCFNEYIAYLGTFTAWPGPPFNAPPDAPVSIDGWEGCMPECTESHTDYLAAIDAFEDWMGALSPPPNPMPAFNLAPQALFTENQLCNCVDQYIARLQSVMVDGQLTSNETSDWTIWNIAVLVNGQWEIQCSPPVACDPVFPPPTPNVYIPPGCPCCDGLEANAIANANQAYAQQMADLTVSLGNSYTTDCLNALEVFTMQFQDPEHHYTLYYYDQAGNLVRTVPPEGVEQLDIGVVVGGNPPSGQATVDAINSDRQNGTRTVFMSHRMPSDHLYNSLNNPIRLQMPDHDRMDIWETAVPNGLPHELRIMDSQFLENRGYLSGYLDGPNGRTRGYVYSTDDGGMSWSRSYGLLASNLSALEFAPNGTGFMVGDRGTLLTSVDGGGSWDLITDLTRWNVDLRDLQIRDNSIAILGGDRKTNHAMEIFRTGDGGVNWTRVTGHATALGAVTGLRGYLNGTVYSFLSSGTVFNNLVNGVVGIAPNAGQFQEWTYPGRTRSQIGCVSAPLPDMVYAGGTNGVLMRLNPAIATEHWLSRPTNTKDDFKRITFVTAQVGVALMQPLGGGPIQLRLTTDFGEHWSQVGDPDWAFNDLRAYNTDGSITSLLAVGNDGLVVRVVLENTGGIGFVPVLSTEPTADLVSVWAKVDGGVTRALFGTSDGYVRASLDLFAPGLTWAGVPSTSIFSGVAISDVVANMPTATKIHAMFRSSADKLAARVLDFSGAPTWGTQATTLGLTTLYTALTMRSDGYAVAFRSDVSPKNLRIFNLNGTASVTPLTTSGPDITDGTIRAMTVMPNDNNSMALVGWNANSIAAPHHETFTFNGTVLNIPNPTGDIPRINRVRPLRLNNIAKDALVAVGDEGTLFHLAAFSNTVWIRENTPVIADLHGVAALNATEIIAVGDNGTAFRIVPNNASTYQAFAVPTTLDLRDVVVNGLEITIAAKDGTLFYCNDYSATSPAWTQLGSYFPEDFQGMTLRNGHVFAVGEHGKMVRAFGTLGMPVRELFTPRLGGVHFTDANVGYTVGSNMVVRYTTDGGISWAPVPIEPSVLSGTVATQLPTQNFLSVHTTAPGAALAVGTYNLYAEFNNGQWTSPAFTLPASPVIHLRDIEVTPSGAQAVVGSGSGGYLFLRPSAGVPWPAATINNAGNPLFALWSWPAYFDPTDGVTKEDILLGGDAGFVQMRRFQGGGWLPSAVSGINNLPVTNVNIRCFWFHDRVAGYTAGTGGKIFRTSAATNIGHTNLTWETTPRSAADGLLGQSIQNNITINTMGFADRHRGFLGGSYSVAPHGFARTVRDETQLYSQRFWYDQLGRMVLSQNTKQFNAEPQRYSYTLYDELGRVKESGELRDVNGTLPGIFGMNVNGMFKPEVINYTTFQAWVQPNEERYEVVRTRYDESINDPSINAEFSTGQQLNLRLRVAMVTYAEQIPDDGDELTFDHASHYSYDIHGNVQELVQEHVQLGIDEASPGNSGRFKRITYEYDLISGKVKQVHYQDGERDQFHHRYTYDADNRITRVETSRNNDNLVMWRTDAEYFYYPHGPLERVEIGDLKVQGMDYAYTLQGWLKGINSDLLLRDKDMGEDAVLGGAHALVGRDVYGLSLGYYGETDYVALNETAPENGPFAKLGGQMAADLAQLYNCNITHTVNSLAPFGGYTGASGEIGQPLAMVYQYDQLNRLRRARGFVDLDATNKWEDANDPEPRRYLSKYTYDANGNIEWTERWDAEDNLDDDMDYYYHEEGGQKQRNRLYHIREPIDHGDDYPDNHLEPVPNLPAEFNDPDFCNYLYDEIGNLVKDQVNEIEKITWTATGKVREIDRPDGTAAQHLSFAYDASGNRREKNLQDENGVVTGRTHYVRDGQGKIMATYQYTVSSASLVLVDRPIYGSSRLGTDNYEQQLHYPAPSYNPNTNPAGEVQYELTDHLDNVTTTVTDELVQVDELQDLDDDNDYFSPVLVSAQGYEAFGSLLPGRNFASNSYRFGFNGKENDDEVHGINGTYQDYGMRAYDTRVGRFFKVDPIASSYPMLTPYQFASNSPIQNIDLDGLEGYQFMQDAQAKWDYTCLQAKNAWNNFLDVCETALTYTDVNDATVIVTSITRDGEAINFDGTPATTADKIFAYGGVLIPFVGGSTIKKGGEAVVGPLLRAGEKAPKALGGLVPFKGFGGDILPRPDKTTTVLGRFSGAIDGLKADGAFNVEGLNFLDLPKGTWTWEKNLQFLDDAMARGDAIRLVSDPTDLAATRVWKDGVMTDELTTFGKEIKYLEGKGYKQNGNEMVKSE